MRSHGWTEPQVLEAVWVVCLFNAIVRLADTFGLRDLGQLADDLVGVEDVRVDDVGSVPSRR
jgi:hypothetical protein